MYLDKNSRRSSDSVWPLVGADGKPYHVHRKHYRKINKPVIIEEAFDPVKDMKASIWLIPLFMLFVSILWVITPG